MLQSGLQHHTLDRGAEINLEEIKDESGDREDDQENLVSECEEGDLEEEGHITLKQMRPQKER